MIKVARSTSPRAANLQISVIRFGKTTAKITLQQLYRKVIFQVKSKSQVECQKSQIKIKTSKILFIFMKRVNIFLLFFPSFTCPKMIQHFLSLITESYFLLKKQCTFVNYTLPYNAVSRIHCLNDKGRCCRLNATQSYTSKNL